MKKWQLQTLAWVFSAFLPKDDEDEKPEDDYYKLLGISRNATSDEIRRAYKKKSLQLHPDKVAQRAAQGDKSQEEIRRDFQKVKEAYETLSDPQQREIYDGLGGLGSKFLQNPQAAMDPHTLLENLAKSSFCDRTKLFMVVLLLVLLVFMQPILICAKIEQDLKGAGPLFESSWVAILTPLWFLDVVFLGIFAAARVVGPTIKLLCIVLLQIFLALKWDGSVTWNYAVVLIPLYLLEAARIGSCMYWIRKINIDILRMVTIDMLEEDIIPKHYSGKSEGDDDHKTEEKDEEAGATSSETRLYADLTEEERDEINDIYIIVHIPPDVKAAALSEAIDNGTEIDHDEMIAQSPEYQAAIQVIYKALRTMRNIVLIHIATIVLLVLKADGTKNYSWWVVSVPIWVEIGFSMIASCWKCCTAGAGMSEEDKVLAAMHAAGAADDDDSADDDKDGGEAKEEEENEEPLVPPTSSRSTSAKSSTKSKDTENKKANTKAERSGDKKENYAVAPSFDEAKYASEEAKVNVDEDSLKTMKISELKAELEAYGIATATFVEKSEFIAALAEARASGMPKAETNTPAPGVSTPSTDNNRACGTNNEKNNDDDDDSSGVYIDEETFRAWAAAQAQDEAKASEIAAKACARCCEQVFWAMMLALFVGKLAGEDVAEEPTGSSAFSSFWILFPFFLIAGIFLCCCCCSIYCASGVDAMEENLKQSFRKPNGDDNGSAPAQAAAAAAAAENEENEAAANEEEKTEAPFIPMPPPPPPSAAPAAASPTSSSEKKEDAVAPEPPKDFVQNESMDDLD